ncbi:MAG: DoxX family protein [Roseivirga sp.]|nr:DoxX family protein [Roseivirga sp.]
MSDKKAKIKNIGAWILQVLLGLEFILAGQAKFTSGDIWSASFEKWGYPDGFHQVIGVLELLGAVLLFVPKLASHAAGALAIIMLAAGITHFANGENGVGPLIIMSLLVWLWYLRKEKAVPLKKR